ncbi:hypothetical protein [Limnoglobus roseus]|uniref:Uncharacterized protein n=1 Tax=Limnoglobus roseus TaxID=2598579 RepID=A0A5C1A947_9BACT|nr:hypothetical protein [Limnoglobus roseus]QEL15889.1 hypothetical protein PX52LOC_02825 [Limnoglobus roseus]
MTPETSEAAGRFVWTGLALMVGAKLVGRAAEWAGVEPLAAGIPVFALGAVLFLWGCVRTARGKGYSPWVGAVGVLWLVGLGVLYLLPDRGEQPPKK